MGKATLLLVAVCSGLLFTRQFRDVDQSVASMEARATEDIYRVLARSSALAGFTRLEQALSGSFASTEVSGAFEGGIYTATADVVGAEARITTEGLFTRPNGDQARVQIRALIVPVSGIVPTDYSGIIDYTVLTGRDLSVGGSSDIVGIGATGVPTYTPRVHSNGDLVVASGAAQVRGFGSHTGTATGPITGAFVPPYNPSGEPVVSQAPAIPLPSIDPDVLASVYGVDHEYPATTDGSPAFAENGSTLPGGTRDAPAVYRVHGNATFSNVVVDGYAVFIVGGSATISGSLRASNPLGTPVESQIAVITTGFINLSGNSSVAAHLFAGAGLRYGGTVDIYGSVMTRESLSLTGSSRIHAYPSPPSFGELWMTGTSGVKVLAYTEF